MRVERYDRICGQAVLGKNFVDMKRVDSALFRITDVDKITDYNFSADPYYALPQNYTNKYNLSRGDFAPLEIKAALNRCLQDRGAVDIEYISMLTMLSLKDTVFALENFVFHDPEKAGEYFYTGYVMAEEYLSGDLFKKLAKASEANAKSGRYEKNIKALKAVLPAKPNFDEIIVTLGSPFLPASFVTDFVQYLYRLSLIRNKRVCEVCYQKEIHDWSVILNVDVKNTVIACKTFGTERIDMFKIIEKTLNHEQIRITDVHETSKTARKFNREQTMIAEEKRTKLIDCFNHWLNDLPDDKKQEIVDSYYERYYCYRPRRFDGKNIELHDLNENIKLYDYQKDAAWRIMLSPATLLAHDVGAGKTYAMVVAAHEMKKSGISKKNLIVVPNSIVAQWANDYKLLYPSAEILTVTPQNFAPAVRKRTLNLIKDGDYDAIIMPYSSFEMIPVSGKNNAIELKLALTRMENAMAENMRRRPNIKNRLNTLLSKAHDKMQVKYNDAIKRIIDYSEQITFEELGITALFIDETHNYNNLPLVSSMGSIKGVNVDGSDKCDDIYLKTSTVLKNGGKLIFATGTPVTNSVADVYVMQKYLDEELLTEIDLDYFDNWVGMFGEITRSYEIDVDTENYRLATRFNRFNNLGILSRLINGFTDFHVVGVDGLPEIAEIKTVVVQKTPIQAELLKDISVRVEKIRSGEVERKEDNLLKVTTDGRKLALDVRLLALQRQILCSKGGESEFWNSKLYGNKISVCAENVFDFYNRFKGKTQLVFCDIGTPKSGFNVYDCLKNELCRLGIKEEEIGFVHDATSEARRARLFESVNAGEIKVLIGSTFKLGTGVNVQEKLIAIHHLDVPWHPSDMVQRDGRLVRRGNTNEKVYIFR